MAEHAKITSMGMRVTVNLDSMEQTVRQVRPERYILKSCKLLVVRAITHTGKHVCFNTLYT
jgi:hypothetical protein